MRIGQGFDVHKFTDEKTGGTQMLGGVAIPVTHQLVAHSDGDVVLHAVTDALLGALGLGDIGEHFPDTDPGFKGADSRKLLSLIIEKMKKAGFELGNLDITIMAQAPKISPYKAVMQQAIAQLFGCPFQQINVKATTTEKLGFVGRKEGIAVSAVLLLVAVNK